MFRWSFSQYPPSFQATSSQQQGIWWVNSWVFGIIFLPSRDGINSLTIKLSSLLLIFSPICNIPSKTFNLLRICREITCSVAPIPSAYWMKHGSCEGTASARGDQVITSHRGFHPLVWVYDSVIATTFPNMSGWRNKEGIKRLFHYVETELGKIMKTESYFRTQIHGSYACCGEWEMKIFCSVRETLTQYELL